MTIFSPTRRHVLAGLAAGAATLPFIRSGRAATLDEIRIDFATYNPVSLLLKDKGWLEEEFKADGTGIRWVQSLGSNKALEFLNAGSLHFGSSAGGAALIARTNGNPIKSVYVYSKPEWTALVTRKDTGIASPADLRAKRIAVTRGTDPHIFLIRALAEAGLKDTDVQLVLLQHGDGKAALIRGDVDAWAGLDPLMAAAEVDDGANLFFRRPDWNTYGVLNTPESFAAEQPGVVARVLAVYEKARLHAIANPAEVAASLVAVAKLPEPVIARQLTRTDLANSRIGATQKETILAAGLALQAAGVIKPEVDVKAAADAQIDERFNLAAK
jgi:sulfonate transport system substrate-binding protein